MWPGTQASAGEQCVDSYASTVVFQIGIVGDDLFMCRSNMEPTLNTCAKEYPRLVAKFHRG